MDQDVIVIGAGGFAREVAWLVESCSGADCTYRVAAFADRAGSAGLGGMLNDIPVMTLDQARAQFPTALAVCGIGAPALRRRLTAEAIAAGFAFGTFVHPTVQRSRFVEIGAGSVVCAGSILTVDIRLGSHVQINLDCTIGHDSILDDFATLAPGVHVSGCVHIGEDAYLGTGAVIVNGNTDRFIEIGRGAVIGAGACVTKDVPDGLTVVGVPARPLHKG